MTIHTRFDLGDRVRIMETGEHVKILEIESIRANGLCYDLYRVSHRSWDDQYLDHQIIKVDDAETT